MARTTPYVEQGTLRMGPPGAERTIDVGSSAWFTWLSTATAFTFTCADGMFTARRERASSGRGGWYWRAYQRRGGELKRSYLGKAEELTLERLQAVAASLASSGALKHAANQAGADIGSSVDESNERQTLPTGTATFLFTDIEGSTQLWEQHREAMQAALARHDSVLQQAIGSHGGVVFKTVGDSLHAAFGRASDALAAALSAQRALHHEDWGSTGSLRVRMALHTGAAELRDGDYFGSPLNRLARILALGHGGQILLSHTTHDLVVDVLPPETSLHALGEYALKDLARPEPIFQCVIADLPANFPPLRTDEPSPSARASAFNLLPTKLYIPLARSSLVARPRLLERLADGLEGKLTLIAAPAGFGKTTLLADWFAKLRIENEELRKNSRAKDSQSNVAWLSLDPADNDPTTFLRYLIAALQTIVPNISTAALLRSPRLPPSDALITALVNDLTTLPDETLLVLDDYHAIATPIIHQALTFLLDHLPPRLHLIIATREDPPLPLARLRARGQLTELRAAELRFTSDEAAAFLTSVMRLPLTAEQVAALELRTEGWIAGLQFAALAMRDHRDIAGFINAFTGSHRFVVDYLAEEVIKNLPGHLQTFLLKTSVLDRMCASLCDAVLLGEQPAAHQPYSQALLEELERANLFIVPLDDTRRWYRYHHLFVDVLRGRLTSGATPEIVATLHRRASAWFEAQGLVAEAVHHALAANDGERAARLVELHGDAVWMHGGLATLLRWLTALPDTAFVTHPKLALNHAFMLVAQDAFAPAERRLAAAERALRAAPVPDPALLGQAAVIRTAIALLTEQPAEVTIAAGRHALDILPEHSATWRSHAGVVLGIGYYVQAGDLELGRQTLLEAEQISLRAGDAFIAASAAVHLSIVLEVGGQLRESEQLNQHYLQRAAEPFWHGVPLAAYACLGLGRTRYERNDLHAARDHLTEALAQLETWSIKRPTIIACVWLARVHQALGEPDQAREWMERVIAIVEKDDLKQTFSHWAAYRARLALAQGDLTIAAEWARQTELSMEGALHPAQEFEHITLAQIQMAQQRFTDAQHLLARLLPAAQAAGRMGRVLEIELLQALTADALGQRAHALTTIERALTLAAPEGYVRVFVDEGAPMAELLREAHARGIAPDYVTKLLAAFSRTESSGLRTESQEPPHSIVSPQSSALVEPLTARELEVLRLLAGGASNGAIAEALIISIGTAKKHVNNILAKLDVRSRTQAAIWARENGLLAQRTES
jgi:LuxR family transcriptional regulator, maltose regulon positive regulatory protein